jgi:hypothetical protein
MRNKIQRTFLLTLILCCSGYAGVPAQTAMLPMPAQSPSPTSLNTIRINQCGTQDLLKAFIDTETTRGLVMDARPFAINQSIGKMSFNGSTGRVSVVHTNPFIYVYRVTVAQEEQVSTALTDFLKLLLPPSLSSVGGLQSGGANLTPSSVTPVTKLKLIEARLDDFASSKCKDAMDPLSKTPACIAIGEMYQTFDTIRRTPLIQASTASALAAGSITPSTIVRNGTTVSVNQEFTDYTSDLHKLRDEEADAYTVCDAAQKLNGKLSEFDYKSYFDQLDQARAAIKDVDVLATDLEDLVTAFKADADLQQSGKEIRCKGLNCVEQFKTYAETARNILGTYNAELDKLRKKIEEMQNMHLLMDQMKDKDGLFARTINITKKFELSKATVSIKREKIETTKDANAQDTTGNQSGKPDGKPGGGRTAPPPAVLGGASSEGTASGNSGAASGSPGSDNFAPRGNRVGLQSGGNTPPEKEPGKDTSNSAASAGEVNEVVQIGKPRFMLSGGLVYSPLPRRTFESVKGFTRDAQGKPTGDGSANIVGFGENSSRRLLPMLLLNSRLLSTESASLYFSLGITAKRDKDVDVEYLLGPSVGFLNDRAIFTFGAYGGQTQNLVSDLSVGDELPDSVGNAKLFRKSHVWKPGFSFSYSFSRTTKKSVAGGTASGAAPSANDLSDEIHIGSIPFNLSVGLAYTSLEQRTYDPIVGFARDRQGNLTNGQTLTRIVGLTSSSSYRITPLAMLHSRLTNFGSHDFYFSSGITGKKTDQSLDIEYLLGGSVNLYQRKIFVTFGTFIGKQQQLGGGFFEGAQLGKGDDVTIQNRYVWKPAIAFSYDISRIIKRAQ